MDNIVLVPSALLPTLCASRPSSFSKDRVQTFMVFPFRSFLYYYRFLVSWLMKRLNTCCFWMTKIMATWFFSRRLYLGVDLSSVIVLVLFTLSFRGGSIGFLTGVWQISGSCFSSGVIWNGSDNNTLGDCFVGLLVRVVTGTLIGYMGVNVMGNTVCFVFYTLRDCFRVYLIIMLSSCSSLCPCLLPIVSNRPDGCGLFR